MKKYLTIILIFLAMLIILLIAIFFLFQNKQAPVGTNPSGVNFPSGGLASTSQSGSSGLMNVSDPNSNPIVVNNFIADKTTVTDPVNKGYYYLGYNTFNGETNIPYMIQYIADTKYFNIELLQEPLGTIRVEAENDLMKRLGITQTQMCQLNYTVSTPDSVNSVYASENLGFSFCPGAVQLPS